MLTLLHLLQITGLSFSSLDPSYIYLQGVDYEVITWKNKKLNFSWIFFGSSFFISNEITIDIVVYLPVTHFQHFQKIHAIDA